jgi:hypothetical protein
MKVDFFHFLCYNNTITFDPTKENVMHGMVIVVVVGVAVAAVAVGVVYLGLSYVTAAGDETRIGMRVARRLGIERDGNRPHNGDAE